MAEVYEHDLDEKLTVEISDWVRGLDVTNASVKWKSNLFATATGLATKIDLTEKAAANGVATLDGSGKVPTSQLPTGGGLTYQGTWDADTNDPELVSGTGTNGDYYIVGVAGNTNLDGITDWELGDWVIFAGATDEWQKIDNSNSVTSVFSRQGAVTAIEADYSSFFYTKAEVDSALSAKGDLSGPASAVDENLAIFDGITGKLIKDGGAKISDLATTANLSNHTTDAAIHFLKSSVGDIVGPASAVDENIAIFDGITGKLIKDSSIATSDLFLVNSPEKFGAVGDGVTDDSTALGNWLDSVITNGAGALTPGKSYRIVTPLTKTLTNSVIIEGFGASIVMDYGDASGNEAIEFKQTVATSKTITAPVKGEKTITMADTSGLTAGMGIIFEDVAWFTANGSVNKTYMSIVASVDSGTQITLQDYMWEDFITTSASFYSPYRFTINNLNMGWTGARVEVQGDYMMRLRSTWGSKLTNVNFFGGGRAGMTVTTAYQLTIDGMDVLDNFDGVYGISFSTLINSTIRGVKAMAETPGITLIASSCYDNHFYDCTLEAWNSYAFDSHGSVGVNWVHGSQIKCIGISSGTFYFDNCDIEATNLPHSASEYALVTTTSGSENSTMRTNMFFTNCRFHNNSGDYKHMTSAVNNYTNLSGDNRIVFRDCEILSEAFYYEAWDNISFTNCFVNVGFYRYMLGESPIERLAISKDGYYYNHTAQSGQSTYSIKGFTEVSFFARTSSLGTVSTDSRVTACATDNRRLSIVLTGGTTGYKIKVFYRNGPGADPEDYRSYETPFPTITMSDKERMIGVSLQNVSGTAGEIRIYVDGRLLVADIIYFESIYTALDVYPTVQAGGNVSAQAYFNKILTDEEWSQLQNNVWSAVDLGADMALLNSKATGTWSDDSGNGNDITVDGSTLLVKPQ